MDQDQKYYAYKLIKELYYPKTNYEEENIPAEEEEAFILNKYMMDDKERLSGCTHVPDMITNINGSHNYKLISGKDIDFENIHLPKSALSEAAWSDFPPERRWGTNITTDVNEMYDLMNIIDYLLYATNDLYAEINSLKYNIDSENIIWFVANSISSDSSSSFYLNKKLTPDLIKNGDPGVGLNRTFLDPTRYSSTVNAKNYNSETGQYDYTFGIGTTTSIRDANLEFERYIKKQYTYRKLNGLQAIIYPKHKSAEDYNSIGKGINSLGREINIYGYLIGEELHLFPGYNILNFLSVNQDNLNIENIVDTVNKKLKNESSFFKFTETEFKKIYVDFLYNKEENSGQQYILYILDKDANQNEIRKIVYYTDGVDLDKLLRTHQSYKYPYAGDIEIYNQFIIDNDKKIPCIYTISDSNIIQLSINTPSTVDIQSANATIDIQYYKSKNNLTINIYNKSNEEPKKVELSKELLQDDITLYNPKRYNIPENKPIEINVDADFWEGTTHIKLDDEYIDELYYWPSTGLDNDNSITLSEAKKYYKYNEPNTLSDNNWLNDGKRYFDQFTSVSDFKEFLQTNQLSDGETGVSQVYRKIENPYEILYKATSSELLDQPYPYSDIVNMVNDMNEHGISKDSTNKNIIKINYNLPEEVEQLKFDLDIRIEETSKVKEAYKKLPFNINKVHDITINFNSPKLYEKEANNYKNIYYGRSRLDSNNSLILQDDPSSNLTAFDLFYSYSKEYQDITNYMNILSYFTFYGESPNDFSNINDDIYNDARSFDNTNSNILNIKYDDVNYYLNLFGGKKLNRSLDTEQRIDNVPKTISHMANTYVVSDIEGNRLNPEYSQIFAIHGLGFNYYCHGADRYVWVKKNISDGSDPNKYSDYFNVSNSHNLLSPCDINPTNNICYLLGISLSQIYEENYENNIYYNNLSYIKIENSDDNVVKYYQDENNDDENEKYKYNGKFISYNDYRVITEDVEIHKYYFSYDMLKENLSPIYAKNEPISYNIQSSYIKVLNSTFHPTPDCYPEIRIIEGNPTAFYDLNNADDYRRYANYKKCWGADVNGEGNDKYYRPITLSLKFFENNSYGTPYFNESNTAKLKFNVVRSKISGLAAPSLDGIGTKALSYISPGIRYYLSDLVDIHVVNTNKYSYTGSYMYLDVDETHNNIMNFKEKTFRANHKYNIGNNEEAEVSKLILKNNFEADGNSNHTFVFPIPACKKDNKNYYYYDIERISEINKVIYTYNDPNYTNNNNYNLQIDTNLSYIIFDDTNLKYQYVHENSEATYIQLIQQYVSGTRNHNSLTLADNIGANIPFKYIHREKNDNFGINYPTVNNPNNNSQIIEIFEYFENVDDLYIKISDSKIKSLIEVFEQDKNSNYDEQLQANIKDDNIYKYYYTEVKHFLDYTIGTKQYFLNNNYTIDESGDEGDESPRSTINNIETR